MRASFFHHLRRKTSALLPMFPLPANTLQNIADENIVDGRWAAQMGLRKGDFEANTTQVFMGHVPEGG